MKKEMTIATNFGKPESIWIIDKLRLKEAES